MNHEKHLPMFVIDVLRYDIEQISNIVTLLNNAAGVGWRFFGCVTSSPRKYMGRSSS
jgi:hypothetical protein